MFIVRKSGDAFAEETKVQVKTFGEEHFGYDLDFSIDEIRPVYSFDVSCQGSCPQAIRSYMEGKDFEDAIRRAVSIAGAAGQIPEEISKKAYDILTTDLQMILDKFEYIISDN